MSPALAVMVPKPGQKPELIAPSSVLEICGTALRGALNDVPVRECLELRIGVCTITAYTLREKPGQRSIRLGPGPQVPVSRDLGCPGKPRVLLDGDELEASVRKHWASKPSLTGVCRVHADVRNI